MTEKPLQAKIRYTRALGTPYVRGKPVEVGKNLSRYKADAPITIGDTVPGQEIYWFEVGNLLIAFEPVLYATHYGTMKELELVHGRQITIDGKVYTCRLIQALQKDGPNGELRMSDEMEEFERVANGWSVFSRQCFWPRRGTSTGFSCPLHLQTLPWAMPGTRYWNRWRRSPRRWLAKRLPWMPANMVPFPGFWKMSATTICSLEASRLF